MTAAIAHYDRGRACLPAAIVFALAVVAPATAQAPIPEGPQAAGLEPFIGAPATAAPRARPPTRRGTRSWRPTRARTCTSTPTRPTYIKGLARLGKGMTRTRDVPGGRLRVGDVRLAGADRDRLRRRSRGRSCSCSTPRRSPRWRRSRCRRGCPGGGNVFNDFAGGGYFYLDERDRAVIPTTTRHLYVVRQGRRGLRARARLRPVRRARAHRQDRVRAARLGVGGCGS